MKRFVLLLSFAVVLFFATSQLNAQIWFHADFENTSGVNDPAAWNKNNVTAGKNVFKVEGGKLLQTSNGCGESTKTPFPVNGSNWTDYTVAADVWQKDNDSFSLLFRYTGPDAYYNFTIGAGDFGNTWFLGKATAAEEACFDANSPNIATGPNGVTIDEAGGTAYTMAVKVAGNKIEVYFGTQVNVLDGKMPPKVGEATDNTYAKGTAGLHFGSNPADLDNIIVFGPKGPVAVEPQGKLTTSWAGIKASF